MVEHTAHLPCLPGHIRQHTAALTKPLQGCFVVEHTAHLPCLPGHGKRWLYHETFNEAVLSLLALLVQGGIRFTCFALLALLYHESFNEAVLTLLLVLLTLLLDLLVQKHKY